LQLEAVEPPPDVVYREGGTEIFNIPGKVREAVYEVLFEQDSDQISVSTMILDAILKARYFILGTTIYETERWSEWKATDNLPADCPIVLSGSVLSVSWFLPLAINKTSVVFQLA
jgi:hypothetical protein